MNKNTTDTIVVSIEHINHNEKSRHSAEVRSGCVQCNGTVQEVIKK